jgi:magnesium-transporting ATPase (P-type)
MNIMLVAVTVVSLIIGQVSTALLVAVLVLLNVALGTRQELKARASVDALAKLQVPQSRVLRDGTLTLVPAVDVVPGDVVQVEAGDIVPADGRIVASATLDDDPEHPGQRVKLLLQKGAGSLDRREHGRDLTHLGLHPGRGDHQSSGSPGDRGVLEEHVGPVANGHLRAGEHGGVLAHRPALAGECSLLRLEMGEVDPGDPDVMMRPPRDPKVPITNPAAITRWLLYGAVLILAALVPLVFGPDTLSTDEPSASMSMSFVVVGLGTVFSGLVMRRDPTSGLVPPILSAVKWLAIPVVLVVLSTELPFMQRALLTQPLTGPQWLICIGLAVVLPVVVEADKWVRRSRHRQPVGYAAEAAVNPARAVSMAR